MMNDDRPDDVLERALRELDPPPPVPRDEMWARIQAQRSARAAGVIELRPQRRATIWAGWSAALAAMLLIGIGLGRISMDVVPPTPVAPGVTAAAEPAVPTAYRLAATQHLERTETLLASLAMDPRSGNGELTGWARELLTDTRLLLASPAAEDVATRNLLHDLELVLTQLATVPSARAEEEVELIRDGINQSGVLLRLRAATASRPFTGT